MEILWKKTTVTCQSKSLSQIYQLDLKVCFLHMKGNLWIQTVVRNQQMQTDSEGLWPISIGMLPHASMSFIQRREAWMFMSH